MTSIEKFIALFKRDDKFLTGLCWHFTVILSARFPGGTVMYEPVENHFVYAYGVRYYDVRGDITELYEGHVTPWGIYKTYDSLESSRIIEQCIKITE